MAEALKKFPYEEFTDEHNIEFARSKNPKYYHLESDGLYYHNDDEAGCIYAHILKYGDGAPVLDDDEKPVVDHYYQFTDEMGDKAGTLEHRKEVWYHDNHWYTEQDGYLHAAHETVEDGSGHVFHHGDDDHPDYGQHLYWMLWDTEAKQVPDEPTVNTVVVHAHFVTNDDGDVVLDYEHNPVIDHFYIFEDEKWVNDHWTEGTENKKKEVWWVGDELFDKPPTPEVCGIVDLQVMQKIISKTINKDSKKRNTRSDHIKVFRVHFYEKNRYYFWMCLNPGHDKRMKVMGVSLALISFVASTAVGIAGASIESAIDFSTFQEFRDFMPTFVDAADGMVMAGKANPIKGVGGGNFLNDDHVPYFAAADPQKEAEMKKQLKVGDDEDIKFRARKHEDGTATLSCPWVDRHFLDYSLPDSGLIVAFGVLKVAPAPGGLNNLKVLRLTFPIDPSKPLESNLQTFQSWLRLSGKKLDSEIERGVWGGNYDPETNSAVMRHYDGPVLKIKG